MATVLNRQFFNQVINNKQVDLFELKNKSGIRATITNYGARIVSLSVPNKQGTTTDVVLGFDSIKDYLNSTEPYYGATIGRYANRIAKGRFKIDDLEFILPVNNSGNHLHGGHHGLHEYVWDVNEFSATSVELSCFSKSGEEGYPGNLNVKVRYELLDSGQLKITFEATTDHKTIINLTNHAFFNLNGKGRITDHLLTLESYFFTPVDSTLIPTGEIRSLVNTPFDFRAAKQIGKHIDENDEQLKFALGYDHNYVLRKEKNETPELAATVTSPQTGIKLKVLTTEPGIHFYTGNFMNGKNKLRNGDPDFARTAFCLETQHFPDSPNHPEFPSTVLHENEIFQSETIYEFSVSR